MATDLRSPLQKAEDDAIFLVSSYGMAAARTTTAKRALDDAMHEERVLQEKLNDAIKAIAKLKGGG